MQQQSMASRGERKPALFSSLAVAAGLCLAACGGQAASAPSSSPPAASPASVTASPAASVKPAASAAASAKPAASSAASAKPAGSAAASAKPAGSAAAGSSGASAKPAASGSLKLTVSWGGNVASFSPLWIAYEQNTFGRYGLNVTLRQIATAAVTPAIVNKEVDVFASSAAPIITADLNGNLDEVYVGSVLNRQTDTFIAAPDIKTADALKGKMVGTDKPGTPGDFNTRQMLNKLGLKPTDVTLRVLGGSEVTVPALLSGQIQAVSAGLPFNFTLADKGYNILTNAYDLPNLSNGYVILKSRESDLGPALPAFLAGIRDAVNIYNTQPDVAEKVLQQYTKETDPKVGQETYNFYKTMVPFDPTLGLKPETLTPMLDFLSGSIPAAKTAKPEQFFDPQYIAKMPPAKS